MKSFSGFCKELGTNLGGIWLALIPFTFAFVFAGIAVNYGWLETSSAQHHYAHEEVPAMDDLAQTGGDLYDAGAVLAREAVEVTADFFAIKPAFAHATNVCTHSSGKVSNDTGFSRHLTSWRYDSGGRRYTVTRHQLLGHSGWHTVDKYYRSIALRYC